MLDEDVGQENGSSNMDPDAVSGNRGWLFRRHSMRAQKDEVYLDRLLLPNELATKGNNKILHTPPQHIIAALKRYSRITRRTLAQLRTNKSPFHTCTKSTTNDIHHHYAPFVRQHTLYLPTAPTYVPNCHPWISGQTPPE